MDVRRRMAPPRSASVAAARWLVGVIAGVALSFVLATLISESLATSVANRAGAIITNAMPSIQTLSNARGDLRQLENDFERYAAAPADARGDLRTRIDATLQTVESNLVSYAALPFFPAERPLSLPCSAWARRSAAMKEAFAVLSASTSTSLGPGRRSTETTPKTWRLASTT